MSPVRGAGNPPGAEPERATTRIGWRTLAIQHPRAARTNAATRRGSFRPGDDSTPLATSTVQGRTRATRPATFSGVRPPARMSRGRGGSRPRRSAAIERPVPPARPATWPSTSTESGAAQRRRPFEVGDHRVNGRLVREPERADQKESTERGEVTGRLRAVKLDDRQADPVRRLGDLLRPPIDEQADRRARGRQGRHISAATVGSTCRGEPGWKFRPIQSAPASARRGHRPPRSGRRP